MLLHQNIIIIYLQDMQMFNIRVCKGVFSERLRPILSRHYLGLRATKLHLQVLYSSTWRLPIASPTKKYEGG